METFTLIVWIMMGPRFEETRMLNLGRGECVERLMDIQADRTLARGQCLGANGDIAPREIRQLPPCAHVACGWDLPGRRRV
jgi:hypothetical protein